MKILIMCEGPNELKIINLLLDNGKLKFTRDDLLDMRPFHARQLTSPQLKPALDAYHGEIAIYRIGDNMTDSLKIPKELLLSIWQEVQSGQQSTRQRKFVRWCMPILQRWLRP